MDWIELIVLTHSESVEAISEIMIQHGSNGVVIEDPLDYYALNDEQREWLQVQQAELFATSDVVVKAYFTTTSFTEQLLATITQQINDLKLYGLQLGKNELKVQVIGEKDWADAWKAYYFPIRVTRFVTIVPDWIDYQPVQPQEQLVRLDPGLAFGTGTHPTTQLSIIALEQIIRGGESIYDVGTGSGVLSIVSRLLGAKQITAFDIDEMATRIAKENIALNPHEIAIEVRENHLLSGVAQPVDVIVANILAEILLLMPQDAFCDLNSGGTLILSGIIDSKSNEVLSAYQQVGFELIERLQMKEWNTFIMKKNEVKN